MDTPRRPAGKPVASEGDARPCAVDVQDLRQGSSRNARGAAGRGIRAHGARRPTLVGASATQRSGTSRPTSRAPQWRKTTNRRSHADWQFDDACALDGARSLQAPRARRLPSGLRRYVRWARGSTRVRGFPPRMAAKHQGDGARGTRQGPDHGGSPRESERYGRRRDERPPRWASLLGVAWEGADREAEYATRRDHRCIVRALLLHRRVPVGALRARTARGRHRRQGALDDALSGRAGERGVSQR